MLEQTAMRVLFIDDDEMLRAANVEALELDGLAARPFADAESALAEIDAELAGVIVSDIRMPRVDGLELLARVRAIDPEIPVILITGHGDVPMAVGALREGAFDFITKPFSTDHLAASVRRAIETRRLVLDNRRLRETAALAEESFPLIGDAPVMVRLRETIAQLAQADFDALIEGETGTGKELAALLLHRLGPRRGRPFVALNCGALPAHHAESELFGQEEGVFAGARSARPGRIQSAGRGSLFLDEIDSMDAAVQVKLLRVIEEREVTPVGAERAIQLDLRILAATKRDLGPMVEAGEFRADLYYRLNVVRLRIPPLRERRTDVPLLFAHFAREAAEQLGRAPPRLTDAVRRHLAEHDWPGNVRELRNFAYRFVLNLPDPLRGDVIEPDLPLPRRVERFEAALLREALTMCGGEMRLALATLGIPRKTLYDKLARHGLNLADFRPKQ